MTTPEPVCRVAAAEPCRLEVPKPKPNPDPGPPGYRFTGRFDQRDAAAPVAHWPGLQVHARFNGTEVWLDAEELVQSWMQGGPSEWDVDIDGVTRSKLVMQLGRHSYRLAGGLAPGEHSVTLFRRSESQTGATRFFGLSFGTGRLLAPPPARERRIEIVGDSASSGFGIEGVGLGPDCPGPDWAARYLNFRRAWGSVLGELVDADVSAAVHSGKGIARNIVSSDTLTLTLIYPRTDPLDRNSVVPGSAFEPHTILLMTGGIDLGGVTDGGAPMTSSELADVINGFVELLRTTHPVANIVLVLSPTVPDRPAQNLYTRTTIRAAMGEVRDTRVASGDTRVYFAEPGEAVPSEITACNGHGSPELHERIARELLPLVKSINGW